MFVCWGLRGGWACRLSATAKLDMTVQQNPQRKYFYITTICYVLCSRMQSGDVTCKGRWCRSISESCTLIHPGKHKNHNRRDCDKNWRALAWRPRRRISELTLTSAPKTPEAEVTPRGSQRAVSQQSTDVTAEKPGRHTKLLMSPFLYTRISTAQITNFTH